MTNNTVQLTQNSKLYSTFTPFINSSKNPRTADKTMDFEKKEKPKKKEGVISRLFAGGMLVLGIGLVAFKRSNLLKMEHFFNVSAGNIYLKKKPKLFDKILLKFFEAGKTVTSFLLKNTDSLSKNTNKQLNKMANSDGVIGSSCKKIRTFFQDRAIKSVKKRYQKLLSDFSKMEESVEKQIKIIEKSAKGEVKVTVHKDVLKEGYQDIPRAVDLTKCKGDKNRISELRRYLREGKAQIQELLDSFDAPKTGRVDSMLNNLSSPASLIPVKKSLYARLNKVSRSIDSNYDRADDLLNNIKAIVLKQNPKNEEIFEKIRKIDESLLKYKFGEVIKESENPIQKAHSIEVRRKHYLDKIRQYTEELEKSLGSSDDKTKEAFKKFNVWIAQDVDGSKKGCIENIRELLKCNDIQTDFVKPEAEVSYLKQFATNDYIALKAQLTQLSRDIQTVGDKETKSLYSRFVELNDNMGIVDVAKIALPLAYVTGSTFLEKDSEKKKNKITDRFIPYTAGIAAFTGTYLMGLITFPVALLTGMLTSLATGEAADYIAQKMKVKKEA